MDIEELDLGGRAYGVLKGARIDTVEDLCLLTAQQLMKLGNFGKKSLDEVQRALEEHSLSLNSGAADPRLLLSFVRVRSRFNLGLSVSRQNRERLARYSVRDLFEIAERLEQVRTRLEDERLRIQILSAIGQVNMLRRVHETILAGSVSGLPEVQEERHDSLKA
ncbi:MAG TPA: DNA-directed RNA polymerase subunit alpha C-terminal domain-containing protein [Bryobacteraceae bacterium]|nr:DNA-directed RNA polymerase subunit alpha C-terminal domain-containing protein [Bryobacteraceae bacterium]